MYRFKRQFCVFAGLLILLYALTALNVPAFGANNITRGNTEYLVGAKVITFNATLDSADRDTSNAFSLAEYAGRNWSDITYSFNAYVLYPDSLEADTTARMSDPTITFNSYLIYPDSLEADTTALMADPTFAFDSYLICPDTIKADTSSLMADPAFTFDSYLVYPDTFRSDSTYAVLRDTVNQTVTVTNAGQIYTFKILAVTRDTINQTVTLTNAGQLYKFNVASVVRDTIAQTVTLTGAGQPYKYSIKSVSRDTVAQAVTLSNTGYPFRYSLGFSTTGDSFNVTTYFYGSMTGAAASWTYIDSIATVAGTSDTTIYGTIDFDNQKWPYYQMQQVDAAGLANDTTVTVTTKLFCVE